MSFFIEPLDDVKPYTSFAADVDLTASAQSPAAPVRGHARWLRVEDVTAGTTLAIVLAGGGGTTRTLTVAAGDEFVGKIVTIKSTTDVSRVTVGW